jgi:hypothetical protein
MHIIVVKIFRLIMFSQFELFNMAFFARLVSLVFALCCYLCIICQEKSNFCNCYQFVYNAPFTLNFQGCPRCAVNLCYPQCQFSVHEKHCFGLVHPQLLAVFFQSKSRTTFIPLPLSSPTSLEPPVIQTPTHPYPCPRSVYAMFHCIYLVKLVQPSPQSHPSPLCFRSIRNDP